MKRTRVSGAVSEGLKAVFTPGGSCEVRWNDQAAVTPFGQEWSRNAEPLRIQTVWDFICDYLVTILAKFNGLITKIEPPKDLLMNPN